MTKKEMFEIVISALETADFAEVTTKTEVLDGIRHEIKLLDRKRSSKSSKPTKTQVENTAYKNAILKFLAEKSVPMTISELMTECPALATLKNQRVSALVTQLKNDGLVVRTMDARKAYFSIAEDISDEDAEGDIE